MEKLDKIFVNFLNGIKNILFKFFKPQSKAGKIIDKLISKEVVSYLIFGVLTTVVSWLSYALFIRWVANDIENATSGEMFISKVLSWIAAVLFAFITNKIFVFESKSFKPSVFVKELLKFTGSRLFTGVIEWFGTPLLVKIGLNQVIFGTPGMLATVIVSVIVVILNYVLSKILVFAEKGKSKN